MLLLEPKVVEHNRVGEPVGAAVNDKRSAVSGQRLTVNGQRSAVKAVNPVGAAAPLERQEPAGQRGLQRPLIVLATAQSRAHGSREPQRPLVVLRRGLLQ